MSKKDEPTVEQVQAELAADRAALAQERAAFNARQAEFTARVESRGDNLGNDRPFLFIEEGLPLDAVMDKEVGEVAALEAFMNEMVTVVVHESTDPNAEAIPVLNCNNRNQPLVRGVPTPMRRLFVEILAHCKATTISQKPNPYELDRPHEIRHTALKYPFAVIEDRNPKGRAWLQTLMQQAG